MSARSRQSVERLNHNLWTMCRHGGPVGGGVALRRRHISGTSASCGLDDRPLHIKTKNFHWHLSGPQFRDYHLLFDEQAASIFEAIDTLAERVRKVGGTTIRSVGHIGRLQTIADDDDEFVRAPEMVKRLLADNRRMAEKQREAIELCDENGDTPTGNIVRNVLDQTERRIWFLL